MGRVLHCLCILLLLAAIAPVLATAQSLTEEERGLLALLDNVKSKIPDIVQVMEKAGAKETVRLGDREPKLVAETAAFFHALLGMGKGTQAYQSLRGKVSDWGTRYAGVERALMLGRALIVQRVFRDTLIRFYQDKPEAIGAIYGEMDIGTWVNMQTRTLQFDKDIDLSSLALDDTLNMMFRDSFRASLQEYVGIADPEVMIRMDALLTPHGRATPEVFICEWGRTFAEMDLLQRGKWKLILLRLEDGSLVAPDEARRLREQGRAVRVVDIETREMSGAQFFWWRAFFENRAVEFPRVTMKTEPMLSLEMSRHLITDIEGGEYTKVDKLLKVMKYLDRSYIFNAKATAAYRNEWNPYDHNDMNLAEFARELTKAKEGGNSALEIARVMEMHQRDLFPQGIEGGDLGNSASALNSLLQRSKAAIIKNSEVALALRLREIASIADETRRNADLDEMLMQMSHELETYHDWVKDYPAGRIQDIIRLSQKLRAGDQWSPEVVAQTMNDLVEALKEDSYQLDKGVIDYLFSPDDARALRQYLRETMRWRDDQISRFIEGLRKKYPSLAKGYDRLAGDIGDMGKELPTFAKVHEKIVAFNEEWSQTIEGNTFLRSMDLADNGLAVIDAFISGKNLGDSAYKTAGAILRIHAMEAFPSLQVAEGIMQAYQTGDTGPAIRSFAFYYFPTFGAFWGMGENLQRFDVYVRDKEFLSHLDAMRRRMVFAPETGHITGIKLKSAYADLFEFRYSPDRDQRAANFVDYFTRSEVGMAANDLPEFRFWMTLIPRAQQRYGYGSDLVDKGDETLQQAGETWIGGKLGLDGMDVSGRKGKYARLRRYFHTNEDLLTAVLILDTAAVAPGFTDLAGPRLQKKRDEAIAALEDRIERAMWVSLFHLLEASAAPQKDLEALIAKLKGLQSDLNLGNTHLADIRGRDGGLMGTIDSEVKQQLSQDYYGKFIYERYFGAYDHIKRIRSDIIDLWTRQFGVDWERMTGPPLKMILSGDARSAPRLTLDVEADLQRAEEALAAHRSRGFRIASDLAGALGRRPDSDEDLAHRKHLAQLGFEIEHLFDDCSGRTIDSCGEELIPEINSRLRQYRDYLAKLRPGECTYAYSEWGECDPKSRRQSRTLLSKSPQGCVERDKPVLQRDCIPPDTGPGKPGDASADTPPTSPDGSGPDGGSGATTPDMVNITVTAPSIWPGVVNETGLHLKREMVKGGATHEMCPHPASAWGEVSGKVNPSFAPRTVDEIRTKFEQDRLTHEKWGRTVEIRPFAIGDYQGLMLESTMRYLRGGWSGDGYRDSGVEAFGHAIVTRGGRTIEITYSVGSSGCWDNSQRAFQESQAAAARAEAQAILAGIRLSEKPGLVQTAYTGPKLDGSDLPVVRLRPDRIPVLKVGETFTVEAVVEKARPEDEPFTYEWTGVQGNTADLKSAAATIRPEAAGKFSVSVSVGGARHHLGSAALEYTVADYKVHVERVPADTGPVSVGAKAGFAARLTVDGQPAQGDFIYRWQPHPEVSFDRLDAAEPDVRAVFHTPGRTGVWVQVLERREGREIPVAESTQLEIEVVAPKVHLVFEPAEPLVGQDVKARLVVEPEMKEIDLRWVPLPFNARQGALSADGRELSFSMKDDRPVQLTVMVRVPVSGESLGLAQGSVTARKYAVAISGPTAIGPKPRVWKQGVGLVEVGGAFAVDQTVGFSADTRPEALSGPLRYEWKVGGGRCGIANPTVREVRVTASEAGTCELAVTVRDRDGIELGGATASFTASVNPEPPPAGGQGGAGPDGSPVEGAPGQDTAPGQTGEGAALVGTWIMNANSYAGEIEFRRSGGRFTARMRLGANGAWEELRDVAFDGINLTFTRPIPDLDQRYTGVMSAGEVQGTFDQAGTGSYPWWMKRGPI